jgi:DMSO/TMAO reductase YedYZ heme-binding membrane subunit
VWRRLIAALLLSVFAITLGAATALAAAPPSAGVHTVSMTGQGSVAGTRQQPQLRLKLSAADGSGWLLELALDPVQAGGESRSMSVLGLDGTFELGTSGAPLSGGKASGTIDQTSRGDLRLTDTKTGTSLDVPFTVDSTGTVTATVTGQWPALPSTLPTALQPTRPQPANHFFWYLSRASGLLSYVLLFLSLCFGTAFKSRNPGLGGGRWKVLDLHQILAVMGLALIALHVFSLLGDKYFNLNLAQLLIPMASPYRPVPMAIGIIAFYASLVAVLAWYSRKTWGNRGWRILHSLAVVVFLLGLVHGIAYGTDTSSLWVRLLYTVSGGVTVFAGLLQLVRRARPVVPRAAEVQSS